MNAYRADSAGIRRFKPYPTYKDSGVEWLGEIPAHWEVKGLKRLASLRAGAAITSESLEEIEEYPVFGGASGSDLASGRILQKKTVE